jgi:hypothetical protein
MGQDDLVSIFSGVGPVERAWLQRHRRDSLFATSSTKNHRGFGFVVFRDDEAVAKLLGAHFSIFLDLPGSGRALEVKQALSSTDIAGCGAPPEEGLACDFHALTGNRRDECEAAAPAMKEPVQQQQGYVMAVPPPGFLLPIPLLVVEAAFNRHALEVPGAEHLQVDEAERKRLELLLRRHMPDHYED